LIHNGEKIGVQRFLVHSVATKPEQVRSINSFLRDTVKQYPDKLIGFGAIHPFSQDLKGDFEHILESGLQGIKLHPDIQKIPVDDVSMRKVFEFCCEYHLPALVHTGDYRYDMSNPNRVSAILKDYPELRMIGAHFGGWSLWEKAAEELHGFQNLLVDSSSTLYRVPADEVIKLIRAFGVHRVFFGTDYPMWRPETELDLFHKLALTAEEQRRILWQNAMDFFGL